MCLRVCLCVCLFVCLFVCFVCLFGYLEGGEMGNASVNLLSFGLSPGCVT